MKMMKWTKTETIKENGKETLTTIIYDDIRSAVLDFMCPCLCGYDCLLYGKDIKKCSRKYYLKHEEEVANLFGLKLFEGE